VKKKLGSNQNTNCKDTTFQLRSAPFILEITLLSLPSSVSEDVVNPEYESMWPKCYSTFYCCQWKSCETDSVLNIVYLGGDGALALDTKTEVILVANQDSRPMLSCNNFHALCGLSGTELDFDLFSTKDERREDVWARYTQRYNKIGEAEDPEMQKQEFFHEAIEQFKVEKVWGQFRKAFDAFSNLRRYWEDSGGEDTGEVV